MALRLTPKSRSGIFRPKSTELEHSASPMAVPPTLAAFLCLGLCRESFGSKRPKGSSIGLCSSSRHSDCI
jgi:hypothetical protein